VDTAALSDSRVAFVAATFDRERTYPAFVDWLETLSG
jgi:hypothetical protein